MGRDKEGGGERQIPNGTIGSFAQNLFLDSTFPLSFFLEVVNQKSLNKYKDAALGHLYLRYWESPRQSIKEN